MASASAGYRGKLFQAVHAEGAKRGMDHDALRDMCRVRFGAHSMSKVSDAQLAELYQGWTGKMLRRQGKLPRAGEVGRRVAEIVSGADLADLAREFAVRGLGEEGRGNFVRRQLKGRGEIRTRADFVRVMAGLRAMNRREQACVHRGGAEGAEEARRGLGEGQEAGMGRGDAEARSAQGQEAKGVGQ